MEISKHNAMQIAKICHEANRIYCESIGDKSQPYWDDAPNWQKDSCYNGVLYRIENPNITPAEMHNNWLKEKLQYGWEYGSVKDPINKLHPCIMAYEDLPDNQKIKDKLFMSIVDIFLKVL